MADSYMPERAPEALLLLVMLMRAARSASRALEWQRAYRCADVISTWTWHLVMLDLTVCLVTSCMRKRMSVFFTGASDTQLVVGIVLWAAWIMLLVQRATPHEVRVRTVATFTTSPRRVRRSRRQQDHGTRQQ
ncbi:hypothetical protein JKP88DRAFT_214899 [Tribonema minus]|uniref:Uncharacterized protein n=1 Tax=Tribonema minus TaxID=303371 RepID=A0A836CE04_9STRA|nr:hypothetical protein JKP88DRAFT_214899 [Tribonema minus]